MTFRRRALAGLACAGLLPLAAFAVTPVEETAATGRLRQAVAVLADPAVGLRPAAQAQAELEALAALAASDELGIAALYLRGRLRQFDEELDDPPEFVRLRTEFPRHPLAQLATLKVLMRRLYAPTGETVDARLAAAEALGAGLTHADVVRDYHLALGEAYICHGDRREPALRHLRAAEAAGIPGAAARADVLVQIGELARLTGDKATAARYYRKFIADFPRDLRQQIVRDHLAELGEGAP